MSVLKNIVSCSCSIVNPIVKPSNGVNLSFVRFRKMRWLQKAPSKLYRVREPTPIDPVEANKMKVWTQHYNTEVKSLRAYIVKHTSEVKTERKRKIKAITLSFKERLAEITHKNSDWNQQTKTIRLAEMAEIESLDKERADRIEARDEREREDMRQAAIDRVLHEKMNLESGQFILEEDLDEELDKLLNTRVDHNFAITLDGSRASASSLSETDLKSSS